MADNITESPRVMEALSRLATDSMVENYGKKSREIFGNGNLEYLIVRRGDYDTQEKLDKAPKGKTSVLFLPLQSTPQWLLTKADIRLSPQTQVAMIVQFKGENADKFGRPGVLRSISLMNAENAEKLKSQVSQNPRWLFSYLRALNKGPITRFDGTPMKINPGESVLFLKNTEFGGKISADAGSARFPDNYDPNPLFTST
jgi:hypothetical protein